jgi:hypothetical protein
MSIRTRVLRLLAGLGLLLALLAGAFAAVIPAIHRWGAMDEEVSLALPGDELLPAPLVLWTNAVTINAPPEQVWPWIAQLGDTRAGFYSYTLIENRVGAITGAADYQVIYRNAGRIVPAWQRPAPGDHAAEPGNAGNIGMAAALALLPRQEYDRTLIDIVWKPRAFARALK